MSATLRCLIAPFAMVAMVSAHAQTDQGPPDTAGAVRDARVDQMLQYRSAFSGYQAWKDQPPGGWREANDLTGRIGGWRAYAREASQPDPLPASGAETRTPKMAPDAKSGATPGAVPGAVPSPAGSSDPHRHHGAKP